jgi:hypothetical protein
MGKEHGTRYRYVLGCRCDECRAANSADHLAYTHRRREPGYVPNEKYVASGQAGANSRWGDGTQRKVVRIDILPPDLQVQVRAFLAKP